MGRGRKPTPTKLKILNGNPGNYPLPVNEPKPQPGLPPPPKHLPKDARVIWRRLAKQLAACDVATTLDALSFETLCVAYAAYLSACAKVSEYGAVWVEEGLGNVPKAVLSPYWKVQNEEWAKIRAMLTEFGMTPSSRTKVQTNTPLKEEADSRFFG